MSFVDVNGARIRYELSGPESAPPLVFSNSLGTDLAMWDPQIAVFSQDFRILRYDTRGHGQSSVTTEPYSIEALANDAVELIRKLGLGPVNFCGLSMGGMTGMSIATRVPDLVSKLILCDTSPKIGTAETWNTRISTVRSAGMQSVIGGILERWYTASFRASFPDTVEATKKTLLSTAPEGYIACCGAIRDADLREAIRAIVVPTHIMTGAHDPVTTPADAHFMKDRIAGSTYIELSAAHLSNVEAADVFNASLSNFLKA
jgi:3-oxoadipate enol-lactonase